MTWYLLIVLSFLLFIPLVQLRGRFGKITKYLFKCIGLFYTVFLGIIIINYVATVGVGFINELFLGANVDTVLVKLQELFNEVIQTSKNLTQNVKTDIFNKLGIKQANFIDFGKYIVRALIAVDLSFVSYLFIFKNSKLNINKFSINEFEKHTSSTNDLLNPVFNKQHCNILYCVMID